MQISYFVSNAWMAYFPFMKVDILFSSKHGSQNVRVQPISTAVLHIDGGVWDTSNVNLNGKWALACEQQLELWLYSALKV